MDEHERVWQLSDFQRVLSAGLAVIAKHGSEEARAELAAVMTELSKELRQLRDIPEEQQTGRLRAALFASDIALAALTPNGQRE